MAGRGRPAPNCAQSGRHFTVPAAAPRTSWRLCRGKQVPDWSQAEARARLRLLIVDLISQAAASAAVTVWRRRLRLSESSKFITTWQTNTEEARPVWEEHAAPHSALLPPIWSSHQEPCLRISLLVQLLLTDISLTSISCLAERGWSQKWCKAQIFQQWLYHTSSTQQSCPTEGKLVSYGGNKNCSLHLWQKTSWETVPCVIKTTMSSCHFRRVGQMCKTYINDLSHQRLIMKFSTL